jgi:hypothetical protein
MSTDIRKLLKDLLALTPFPAIFVTASSVVELPRGRDWQTVKDQVGDLVSGATIVSEYQSISVSMPDHFQAIFLGGVQAQIIALSYQDNSTRLKAATNVLGFAGVLLDVSSACLALLSSTVLQRHISVVENQLDVIEDASREQLNQISRFLAGTQVPAGTPVAAGLLSSIVSPGLSPYIYRRVLAKMQARLAVLEEAHTEDLADDGHLNQPIESPGLDIEAVPKSLAQIQSAASIGEDASAAMQFGVLCFFASVMCLAISTQPRAVWIVAAVITALMAAAVGIGFLIVVPSRLRQWGISE